LAHAPTFKSKVHMK